MPMKRVRVDFVATRSVVVAVNDKDDAIETAEEWLSRKDPCQRECRKQMPTLWGGVRRP